MAKVAFASLQKQSGSGSNGGGSSSFNEQNSVGFFSLKNDGEEAIVRFIEDDPNDFEILSTHAITVNGKYRSISCIREDHDPVEKCPLCAAGNQLRRRLFIKMIQYVKNADGTITAKPVMWERAVSMAYTLASYIENYGPLSEIVCKVIRHGAHGNMQTTYEIVPNLSKSIYRDDLYICDKTPFASYSVLGRAVMDRNADEINQYLATGDFPARQRQENASTNADVVPDSISQSQVVYNQPQTSYAQPTQQAVPAGFTQAAEPVRMPWETAATASAPQPAAPQRMPWEQAPSNGTVGGVQRPAQYY